MKTYSRQRARIESGFDAERLRKRIRMGETGSAVEERLERYGNDEAVQVQEAIISTDDPTPRARGQVAAEHPVSSSVSAPSSPPPADRILFSSDALQEDESELSSAPSSPPPLPSPSPAKRKSAFSFLKRKRATDDDGSTSEPLSDITPNARKVPRRGKKSLRQMKIDLGGEVRKSCRSCGMEFVPSVREDSTLHSKFCAMNVGGVDMGKTFLKDDSVKRLHSEKTTGSEKEMVVVVDRKSSLAARNKTRRVLELVNDELSSADIRDDQLWGVLYPAEKVVQTRKGKNDQVDRRGDRFKAFLYMVQDRCVGFCLSEKISNAFQVVPSQTENEHKVTTTARSSSISISTRPDVALLGISRIWTSKTHRGQGLAIDLLNCAKSNFFYGVEAPKNLVAFSQPTDSGGRLAERWFKAKFGWHVYGENH